MFVIQQGIWKLNRICLLLFIGVDAATTKPN